MDQKDVKDIKAKADGPGNLKSWRAKKDVKDIKAKADGPGNLKRRRSKRWNNHQIDEVLKTKD